MCQSGPFFTTKISTRSHSDSILSVLNTKRRTSLLVSTTYLKRHSGSGDGECSGRLVNQASEIVTVWQNMSWPMACA